ncbi:citrate lyase acyl carrier protein [Bacillota bacterium Meth-B3]
MEIVRAATAGSLESSDAMVTVEPREDGVAIEVASVVLCQFGDAIERAVRAVLNELHVERVQVRVNDRGAVECALKARVETALRRAGEVQA